MILNFSSYAQAIKRAIPKSTNKEVTNLLIGFIIKDENVLNKNGEPYSLNSNTIFQWWHQNEDIPSGIKTAAASPAISSEAIDYFESNIIPKISPQKELDLYHEMRSIIEADTEISGDTRNDFLTLHENNNLTEFLVEVFLYAIQKDNKKTGQVKQNPKANEAVNIEENLANLQKLIQKFKKPDAQTPPKNFDKKEMTYVSELLAAYADDNGKKVIRKEDIVEHPKYGENFQRHRKDYYAAETIRQSARDILLDTEKDEFSILTEETYDGIIDVHEDDYNNGYKRLKSVMKHVTTIQLNKSILNSFPGWISTSEKKGVCHILVNDGKIKWVNQDE
ncbi:hypothetical protein FZC76_05595 [Sutcliffiella horikoshii]|uniref:ABC-three component systems C-terminal domain-containing protein n=1 Tax=Sutcliffiella horikoshii TaxID=79883 RepID=A0A5D4T487_9BACI|nr:ABC-three component system protein [Sutcliffiella horikoshii]TYS69711.1 hypothetical protein FZC76_05595 [Sutcliffiella horikoshii]